MVISVSLVVLVALELALLAVVVEHLLVIPVVCPVVLAGLVVVDVLNELKPEPLALVTPIVADEEITEFVVGLLPKIVVVDIDAFLSLQ